MEVLCRVCLVTASSPSNPRGHRCKPPTSLSYNLYFTLRCLMLKYTEITFTDKPETEAF